MRPFESSLTLSGCVAARATVFPTHVMARYRARTTLGGLSSVLSCYSVLFCSSLDVSTPRSQTTYDASASSASRKACPRSTSAPAAPQSPLVCAITVTMAMVLIMDPASAQHRRRSGGFGTLPPVVQRRNALRLRRNTIVTKFKLECAVGGPDAIMLLLTVRATVTN